MVNSYKILLVGDAQVGCSTFLKRCKTDIFETKYVPTLDHDVCTITVNTQQGPVTLNVWDCTGNPDYKGLGDANYIGANACIVMGAANNISSLERMSWWTDEVENMVDCPTVWVYHNKCDEFPNHSFPGINISSKNDPHDVLLDVFQNHKSGTVYKLIYNGLKRW